MSMLGSWEATACTPHARTIARLRLHGLALPQHLQGTFVGLQILRDQIIFVLHQLLLVGVVHRTDPGSVMKIFRFDFPIGVARMFGVTLHHLLPFLPPRHQRWVHFSPL